MTNVVRRAGSVSTVIQQRISAGSLFNGALPVGDSPVDASNALYKYAPGTVGGLFFWNVRESMVCSQIHLDLGAVGDVTISLVNLEPTTIDTAPTVLSGEEIILKQATGVRYFGLDETQFRIIMLPFQALKIVTAGTAAAQIAQVVGALERALVR
jgi:hypothetical protein